MKGKMNLNDKTIVKELIRKFKTEVKIALNFAGYLSVLFLLGCSERSEFLLNCYKERNVVKDSKGNQYKVIYKSKFPHGYGCDVIVYESADGKKWNEIGAIPTHGYETYENWGYFLTCGENDILYFVCAGTGKGKKAIYFSKSIDNGRTWTKPIAVNDDIYAQRNCPKIASKGKNIFIAWLEEPEIILTGEHRPSGIYLCSSSDGGESWSKEVWVGKGEDFWIVVTEEILYLTYVGGRRKNIIFISYSKDRGINWHTKTTGELLMMVKEPYLISSGNTIYLVFQGTRPTFSAVISGFKKLKYEIYYLKSDDQGKNWSKIEKIKGKKND